MLLITYVQYFEKKKQSKEFYIPKITRFDLKF